MLEDHKSGRTTQKQPSSVRLRLATANVDTPKNVNYVPELDVTEELDKMGVAFFHELIGILRWATEIGRVVILLFKVLITQNQASPRQGHLERLRNIFAFLREHPKLKLSLSPELPQMDFGEFRTKREDFAEIYRNVDEQLPPHRMPTPRGRNVTMTVVEQDYMTFTCWKCDLLELVSHLFCCTENGSRPWEQALISQVNCLESLLRGDRAPSESAIW